MKANKLLIATLSLLTVVASSCLKDESKKNMYKCDNGYPKYLTLHSAGSDYIPDEGTYANGGTVQIVESSNLKRTAVELYIASNSKLCGVQIKMNNLVGVGKYVQSEIYSSKITINEVDYDMFNTVVYFTNLSEVTESTQPNILYYGSSSGSFSGQYILPNTTDTLNVEGNFCTDEFPG